MEAELKSSANIFLSSLAQLKLKKIKKKKDVIVRFVSHA